MRANRSSLPFAVLILAALDRHARRLRRHLVGACARRRTRSRLVARHRVRRGAPAPRRVRPPAPDQVRTATLDPTRSASLVDDAKIVRTGTIELQVSDVPSALLGARDGDPGDGRLHRRVADTVRRRRPVATITYRIPVDRWEDALDLPARDRPATAQGRVRADRTRSRSPAPVVDLEARIRNLQAERSGAPGHLREGDASPTSSRCRPS